MQNSEVEDGADEPVKEEARSREIIKGNATNGGTVAHTPICSAQSRFHPFWMCAAKLNRH